MPEPALTSPPNPPATTAPPPPDPRPADAMLETKVRVEFVRMAYDELNNATTTTLIAALGYAIVLSTLAGEPDVWWWFAVVAALSASRYWLARSYKQVKPTPDESRGWGLRFVIATSLTAAAFGALVLVFPLLAVAPYRTAHVLVLTGLSIGSSRILLPMRKGHTIHLASMMLPLAASFFTEGSMTGIGLGLCVVLFTGYTVVTNLRNHRTLSEALMLRFEREALADQLEAEIQRREARELELQEAREKAETASTAKSEFLAVMSHEIRTPMNGVLGMLRIVRDTELTAEQRGFLRTASDSAEALLLLLNDILDFSKIEAGRLELESAPFPPAAMAKGVVDLLHARARDKGLALELALGENLPGVIISDSARLRQILVNLIGNAIKFTERGKVELSVQCVERTATKAMMHFTVTDTGIGIDTAAQERLFKPFTQADSSMSRKYGGTGLGLAISHRIAQAMGGALQVSSVLNKGSTFRVIVPCRIPEITETAPRPVEAPKFVAPSLRGRVLVVEDDSVNQQVIELFLKKIGLTSKFAPDGEMAISTATAEDFDLVLMDCQLPGIDGLEATRRIRQKLGDKPLTIIALTANASTTVRENCLAAGMNDFLSKPVRFELLCSVLQRHLPGAN